MITKLEKKQFLSILNAAFIEMFKNREIYTKSFNEVLKLHEIILSTNWKTEPEILITDELPF